jgi:hypothetical protein
MNRKIYSSEDLPEAIDGVIYLEEGDEIRGLVDFGTNAIVFRPKEVAESKIESNEDA